MYNKEMNISKRIKELQFIDQNQLLTMLSIIPLSYISAKFISNNLKNYKIYKESINPVNIPLFPPPNISNNIELDITNIQNQDYYKYIYFFIQTLQNKLSPKELTLLYNNLKTLHISPFEEYAKKHKIDYTIVASYIIDNNTIVLNNNFTQTIFHELLHCSSSYYDKINNIRYSGFMQSINNKVAGKGLTEGYTQKLTEDFFKKEGYLINSYNYEKNAAKNTEKIIGKDKMQEFYFTANLEGLIKELSTYTTEEEIYKFINDLDFIVYYLELEKPPIYAINIIINKIKNINHFLIDTYLNKLTKGNKLDKIQIEYDIYEFLRLIPNGIIINNQTYNIENSNYYQKKIIKKLIP